MDDSVVEAKALRLLREMRDRQAYGIAGVRVIPHQVAHHAGLDSHTKEYDKALGFLLDASFLVPREGEVEPGAYEITPRGLDVLRKREENS